MKTRAAWKLWPTFASVAVWILACSAPDRLSGPAVPKHPSRIDDTGCYVSGPTMETDTFGPNDCPSDPFVGTTATVQRNLASVMTDPSPDPRTDNVWRGENVDTPAEEAQCPPVLYTSVRINWDGVWYTFPGFLYYQGPAPASPFFPSAPHGYYSQAPDDNRAVVSDDLRSQIAGYGAKPQVVIACGGDYRFNLFGERVWIGVIAGTGMWGHIAPYASYNRPTSYDPEGWSYGEYTYSATGTRIAVRVENGVGDGWRGALDEFLSGGGCTPGWEVWVDGEQRCRVDGTAVMD